MPLTIWKTVLALAEVQDIEIPAGADFLCAKEQYGLPTVWYRCDPTATKIKRRLAICGTGGPAPPKPSRYLGTVSLSEGFLQYHVFEYIE